MNPLRSILLALFLTLAVAGGWQLWQIAGETRMPEHATLLPEPRPLPAFMLVDQDGAVFDNSRLAGSWHLVFFGFTHCPDICPATLQQLAIAREQVLERGAAFPEIVLVSVDPERDTPEVMAAYVGHFGSGITGLTGDLDEIRSLTSATGVYFAKAGNGDADYGVDHSAYVLVIDDGGNWHSLFRPPHTVDQFVADVPKLMASR